MRKGVSSLVTLQGIHNPACPAALHSAPSIYISLPTIINMHQKNFTSAVDSALSKVYIRPAHDQHDAPPSSSSIQMEERDTSTCSCNI